MVLRWLELSVLFIGTPLLLAYALPPTAMWSVLAATTLGGIVLLHITPGFSWRDLLRGGVLWREIAAFTLITITVSAALTMWLMPDMLFLIPRAAPITWITIMIGYPIISALPQEVLFRALFFRRYADLIPARYLLWVNAALFSLAHLMYQNWVVFGMTFAGGVAFAWAYHVRGSFLTAVIMHALAGMILFTLGLGRLFYSGALG